MDKRNEEYKRLAQQIEAQFRLIVQVFAASVLATIALFGYIFDALAKSKGTSDIIPFLPLASSFVVVAFAYFISELRKEIFKWAMYIKVYLEDGNNWRYETELAKYRQRFRERESFNPVALIYVPLFIIASLLFGWSLSESRMPFLWLVTLLIPFSLLLWWYKDYINIPYRYSKQCEDKWMNIKNSSNKSRQIKNEVEISNLLRMLDRLDKKLDYQWVQSISVAAIAVGLTLFGVGLALPQSKPVSSMPFWGGVFLMGIGCLGVIGYTIYFFGFVKRSSEEKIKQNQIGGKYEN